MTAREQGASRYASGAMMVENAVSLGDNRAWGVTAERAMRGGGARAVV